MGILRSGLFDRRSAFQDTRTSAQTSASAPAAAVKGSTLQIISFTISLLSFTCRLDCPLAILPAYVHLRMGMSAVLAGLVISIQYIATFLSRPWAGRISDSAGAKVSVLWGMGACSASGGLVLLAAGLHRNPWLAFSALIVGRLVLGIGESLGSTGATLWGIASAGPEYTAKVISFNGISTFGALALGAPLGVVLEQYYGLTAIGVLTMVICAISMGDGEPQESSHHGAGQTSAVSGRAGARGSPWHGTGARGRGVQRAGYVCDAVLRQPPLEWGGAVPDGLRDCVCGSAHPVYPRNRPVLGDSR